MFTGLVREIGVLERLTPRRGAVRLTLRAPAVAPLMELGDSLAVNGICLTVIACNGPLVSVEAVTETKAVTTLSEWRSGRRVHLEPALRAGDRLGGHLVLGHVDGVGRVRSVRRDGAGLVMRIEAPQDIVRWLLPKGSVAVDGVSLTLDEGPFEDGFTLNLIPYTLRDTLFADMKPGRSVNLEADVLAKGAAAREHDDKPAKSAEPADPLTVDKILSRGYGRNRTGR